jgi:hypothetical protein
MIVVPAMAQSTRGDAVVVFPADGIGKTCEIVLKSKEPGCVVTYAAEIARRDHDFIVLRNGTRTASVDKTVPFLGHLPLVGRLFRYTAVGTEKVSGELKVPRAEVARVEIAE